jgi:hypothetical protein
VAKDSLAHSRERAKRDSQTDVRGGRRRKIPHPLPESADEQAR